MGVWFSTKRNWNILLWPRWRGDKPILTIDEAIYCMKSYLPGNEIEDCLNCPYYGDDLISHCRSSDAHKLAIMALEEIKERETTKYERCRCSLYL